MIKMTIFFTPARFCLGGKLENLPLSQTTNDLKKTDSTLYSQDSRIQIQNMVPNFWKKIRQRLCTLTTRKKKWRHETSNLEVGDIVFLIDENVPPLQWSWLKFNISTLSQTSL